MEIEKQRNRIEGAERWLSLLGGGAAVLWGLKRRSLAGSAVALAGANYFLRGVAGDRNVLEFLGVDLFLRGCLPYGRGIKMRRSVTIGRSQEELYRYWHNFENLPRFMKHVKSVRVLDGRRSHWIVTAPAGQAVSWDAEIIADRTPELIGWRASGGGIDHAGSVRFEKAPGERGTVVRVQLQYNPAGGRITASIAKLFGEEPDQQIHDDLLRFKQLMEVGEIVTTEGQPSGREAEARQAIWAEREELAKAGPVEEAAMESFPASDAPSWASGI
ncbi:MAG: SRPBCC family protein [Rhodospirillales bacterium]